MRSQEFALSRFLPSPEAAVESNEEQRRARKGKESPFGTKHSHLAVRRCANSSWNMMTAHRNMGRCASSLNSKGDEICEANRRKEEAAGEGRGAGING